MLDLQGDEILGSFGNLVLPHLHFDAASLLVSETDIKKDNWILALTDTGGVRGA